MGANVVGANTLGRTIHHDCGDASYDAMDNSVKRPKKTVMKKSSSAEERVALFRQYKSADRIAEERGLALSTVYAHLFNTGTLDRQSFISQTI